MADTLVEEPNRRRFQCHLQWRTHCAYDEFGFDLLLCLNVVEDCRVKVDLDKSQIRLNKPVKPI